MVDESHYLILFLQANFTTCDMPKNGDGGNAVDDTQAKIELVEAYDVIYELSLNHHTVYTN
jgi:hypothetical protein